MRRLPLCLAALATAVPLATRGQADAPANTRAGDGALPASRIQAPPRARGPAQPVPEDRGAAERRAVERATRSVDRPAATAAPEGTHPPRRARTNGAAPASRPGSAAPPRPASGGAPAP